MASSGARAAAARVSSTRSKESSQSAALAAAAEERAVAAETEAREAREALTLLLQASVGLVDARRLGVPRAPQLLVLVLQSLEARLPLGELTLQ